MQNTKWDKVKELMGALRGKNVVPQDNTVMKGVYDGNPQQRNGQAQTGFAGGPQTLGDDGDATAGARAALGRDEPLVREVLGMVGVDYDALIAMDGKSPYSLAVQANPAIVDDILKDERPVLAGLKVAFGYKPVAEFQGKYGSTPDEIKAKIRDEVMAEVKGNVEAPVTPKGALGPLFSSAYGRGGVTKAKGTDLASLFKR